MFPSNLICYHIAVLQKKYQKMPKNNFYQFQKIPKNDKNAMRRVVFSMLSKINATSPENRKTLQR